MALKVNKLNFYDCLSNIVDNRGRSCPTTGTGIPLIATNCIKNDSLYPVFENIRYLNQETYNNWFRAHPKPGDMIFVCKGSPGRVCWTPDPINFCIAQDMLAIRANETIVYPKYLFALLRSKEVQQSIENLHVGSFIPHFKKGDFDKLILNIPENIEFQKKVGDIYFDFCQKIELSRQMNKTLEEMAQALYKKYFVTGIDPDNLPEGWKWAKYGDFISSISQTHKFSKDTIIFLNTSDILEGKVLKHNHSEVKSLPGQAKKSIRKHDILFSEIRPANKRFAFINFDSEDYVVSTKLMVLRSKSNIDSLFFYFLLTRDETLTSLQNIAESRSGTFPQITFDQIKEMEFMIPNNGIIETFIKYFLEPIYQIIFNNEKEIEILVKSRDCLLPKLLNGELSVDSVSLEESPKAIVA